MPLKLPSGFLAGILTMVLTSLSQFTSLWCGRISRVLFTTLTPSGIQQDHMNVAGTHGGLLQVHEVFASLYNDWAIAYRIKAPVIAGAFIV